MTAETYFKTVRKVFNERKAPYFVYRCEDFRNLTNYHDMLLTIEDKRKNGIFLATETTAINYYLETKYFTSKAEVEEYKEKYKNNGMYNYGYTETTGIIQIQFGLDYLYDKITETELEDYTNRVLDYIEQHKEYFNREEFATLKWFNGTRVTADRLISEREHKAV